MTLLDTLPLCLRILRKINKPACCIRPQTKLKKRAATLRELSVVKDISFRLTVTWKLYFDLGVTSKIMLVHRNIGSCIRDFSTVFIAIIQISLGKNIRILKPISERKLGTPMTYPIPKTIVPQLYPISSFVNPIWELRVGSPVLKCQNSSSCCRSFPF